MSNENVKTGPSFFVWYELHTFDAVGAGDYYSKVLGWTAQDSGMPDKKYLVVSAGARMVGGLLEKPRKEFEGGGKPMWVGYIGVANADAAAASIVKAGGVLNKGPEDIPNIGRYAVMSDPQGAIFVVFQPYPGDGRPEVAPSAPGTFGWSQLSAADGKAAFEFYSKQFGWVKSGEFDMGSSGMYEMFNPDEKTETMIGGMMTRMDKSQAPAWLFFINVDDADAAAARVKENGGTVLYGPGPVPGGQRVATCVDPQGGMFGIMGPK